MHCRAARSGAPMLRGGEQNVLPRFPLHTVRHAIERDRFGKARIGVATAPVVSLAWFVAAAPPQREGVAIAPLLARLLGGKPRRIYRRRQFWFHFYRAHASPVCLVVMQNDSIFAMLSFIPSPREAVGRDGEYRASDMSRVGGVFIRKSPPLTPPHHALRARAGGEKQIRSRDAAEHPSYGKPLSLTRHHRT